MVNYLYTEAKISLGPLPEQLTLTQTGGRRGYAYSPNSIATDQLFVAIWPSDAVRNRWIKPTYYGCYNYTGASGNLYWIEVPLADFQDYLDYITASDTAPHYAANQYHGATAATPIVVANAGFGSNTDIGKQDRERKQMAYVIYLQAGTTAGSKYIEVYAGFEFAPSERGTRSGPARVIG